ncbi:rodlin [Streptomyces sp. NPDC003077]|uniref:rodlin n=1 Tax=Streptomyces sp. NPDC003077 TaxID=3154443 RepID=UPI0033B7375F
MMKKALAVSAAATSLVGLAAAAAPQAMAHPHAADLGPASYNGNGTMQSFGNMATAGNMSPQFALIQGSFNKPCIAIDDLNIGSVVGLIPITVQDIQLLSSEQHQTCAENSTQIKGDDPLAHFLEDVPLLSRNNADNH